MHKPKVIQNLIWAKFCSTPDFIEPKKYTGRRALGIKYECKIHKALEAEFGFMYVANPWIKYQCKGKSLNWAQPDALIVDIEQGTVTILEMKYTHTYKAYKQVVNLYLPLIKKIFGKNFEYRMCEVTRWYDPLEYFPKPHKLVPSLTQLRAEEFSVHIRRVK